MTHDTFNAKDVSIMKILETSELPPWKRKIHRRLLREASDLPLDGECSVQTVGRRVDRLFEQEYVEAVPVASEEVNRALITGYRLTEEGEAALARARDRVLRESTAEYIEQAINGERTMSVDREFLLDAFVSRYGVSRETIETTGDGNHLRSFLALFYSSTALKDVCDQEEFRRFVRELKESDAGLVSEVAEVFAPILA